MNETKQNNNQKKIKTPISYYGGKQMMIKHILPLIPDHYQYVEAFTGGGALFWAKEPSCVEVINDLNRDVVNFYEVLKSNFGELNAYIQASLHSEIQHKDSKAILKSNEQDTVKRAWAFWFGCNVSFSSGLFKGFAFANDNSVARKMHNKKAAFTEELAQRLEQTQIFCRDAVDLIKLKDREDVFFYLDPPYFNSDCGHYKGYSEKDFKVLLETLVNIKGKFLLSSYKSDLLDAYIQQNGWKCSSFEKALAVSNKTIKKRKIELLTRNY